MELRDVRGAVYIVSVQQRLDSHIWKETSFPNFDFKLIHLITCLETCIKQELKPYETAKMYIINICEHCHLTHFARTYHLSSCQV